MCVYFRLMMAANDTYATMERRFYEDLERINTTKRANSKYISDERYEEIIQTTRDVKNGLANKHSAWFLRTYDILDIGPVQRLVHPERRAAGDVLHYVKGSELFEILKKVHLDTGHGTRDRMEYSIRAKYVNIPRSMITLFKRMPYEAMFGRRPATYLSSVIPPELVDVIGSEEELRCLFDTISASQEELQRQQAAEEEQQEHQDTEGEQQVAEEEQPEQHATVVTDQEQQETVPIGQVPQEQQDIPTEEEQVTVPAQEDQQSADTLSDLDSQSDSEFNMSGDTVILLNSDDVLAPPSPFAGTSSG